MPHPAAVAAGRRRGQSAAKGNIGQAFMPILQWLTRDQDLTAADDVPYRLLEEDPALSVGAGDNLLVQGDNLEALLPRYAGRVKCFNDAVAVSPPGGWAARS